MNTDHPALYNAMVEVYRSVCASQSKQMYQQQMAKPSDSTKPTLLDSSLAVFGRPGRLLMEALCEGTWGNLGSARCRHACHELWYYQVLRKGLECITHRFNMSQHDHGNKPSWMFFEIMLCCHASSLCILLTLLSCFEVTFEVRKSARSRTDRSRNSWKHMFCCDSLEMFTRQMHNVLTSTANKEQIS